MTSLTLRPTAKLLDEREKRRVHRCLKKDNI